MFVTHYQSLGWSVIIYDRFGLHETFLGGLLSLPGVFYHPYTVYQLAEPLKYNEEYKNKQVLLYYTIPYYVIIYSFIYLFIYSIIYLYLSFFLYLYIYLSIYLFIHLSICLFIYSFDYFFLSFFI